MKEFVVIKLHSSFKLTITSTASGRPITILLLKCMATKFWFQ